MNTALRQFAVRLRKTTQSLLTKHLLLTNTVSCGVLMGVGDVCAQKLHMRLSHQNSDVKSVVDFYSVGRLAFFGFLSGPLCHVWYSFLDRKFPGTAARTIFKKVLIDQTICSPLLIIVFFLVLGTMEGKRLRACRDELREKFVPIYKVDLVFWPAIQTVNFYFIPSNLRVLYVNMFILLWDSFMAYMKHKNMGKEKELDGNAVK